MTRGLLSSGTRDERRRVGVTLCSVIVIVASQAWPWSALAPLLPPLRAPTRSPSSDVLLQTVPIVDAATQLDRLHASLPEAPGAVVVHGDAAALVSAYMVIAMRIWPRPVSLVACAPVPHVEQFRVPHAMPPPRWRIDLTPGRSVAVLRAAATSAADAPALCRDGHP